MDSFNLMGTYFNLARIEASSNWRVESKDNDKKSLKKASDVGSNILRGDHKSLGFGSPSVPIYSLKNLANGL